MRDRGEVTSTDRPISPSTPPSREPRRCRGCRRTSPAAPTELTILGRTLKKPAEDVLGYFDRPGTSNGPTEAINGRLEHLRGSAVGFRSLTNDIARSLLESRGFRPQLHPGL